MLVLTRLVGQSIIVVDEKTGDQIKIVLTRVKEDGQVRIGFECDKNKYKIFREELNKD